MTPEIRPYAGFGIGLRTDHYGDFIEHDVPVDFVEVISENFMLEGGRPLRILEQVRTKYDVILHGVSMSVGSAHGIDGAYLARLKSLAERIDPLWISDHLCWTRTSAHNSHDLLPLPLTTEALDMVCRNIDHAQNILGRAMLFENPSSYLTFPEDEMTEWEFITAMARRTGCFLLLDINNIYVSAHNHGFAAKEYLAGIPHEQVRQIHLAGHTPGPIIIDTHDRAVADGVWSLYKEALHFLGPVATMIERDDNIPPLTELLDELDIARSLAGCETLQVVS
ncbi:MNIO family bufferin maturase [Sphingorhabdus contaminans]|uniref:MNIO family bufferin maturase n=1 Tax=Sphingorhabdus contaminans TaxID=1343899 RepID=UPI003D2B7109